MAEEKSKSENKSVAPTIQQSVVPAITTILGLIAGLSLAAYNSDLATNRFFLEKQAKTADTLAVEFSRYIENWTRLVRLRKEFDAMNTVPIEEQRDYFKKVVFDRADARDKLFSSLDAAHLYYGKKTSDIVVKFRDWDTQQSELTIDKLPDIKEWRKWQIDILHQLHEEITK
jgi:hypothetical protein